MSKVTKIKKVETKPKAAGEKSVIGKKPVTKITAKK
jgi:hypothetical protein